MGSQEVSKFWSLWPSDYTTNIPSVAARQVAAVRSLLAEGEHIQQHN